MANWIAVNKAKPEINKKVLALDDHGWHWIAQIDESNNWHYSYADGEVYISLKIRTVTHWQPLPEKP